MLIKVKPELFKIKCIKTVQYCALVYFKSDNFNRHSWIEKAQVSQDQVR